MQPFAEPGFQNPWKENPMTKIATLFLALALVAPVFAEDAKPAEPAKVESTDKKCEKACDKKCEPGCEKKCCKKPVKKTKKVVAEKQPAGVAK
jgi:hypothetical protein